MHPRPVWYTDDIKFAVDSARAHPFGEEYLIRLLQSAVDLLKRDNNTAVLAIPIVVAGKFEFMLGAAGIAVVKEGIKDTPGALKFIMYYAAPEST